LSNSGDDTLLLVMPTAAYEAGGACVAEATAKQLKLLTLPKCHGQLVMPGGCSPL
jgi:hypothetical protein